MDIGVEIVAAPRHLNCPCQEASYGLSSKLPRSISLSFLEGEDESESWKNAYSVRYFMEWWAGNYFFAFLHDSRARCIYVKVSERCF